MTNRTQKAFVAHETLWQLHGLAKDAGQITLAHQISDLIAASTDQPCYSEAELRAAHANGFKAGAQQLLNRDEPPVCSLYHGEPGKAALLLVGEPEPSGEGWTALKHWPVVKVLDVPSQGVSVEDLLEVGTRFPDRHTIYAEVLKRPGNRRTSIENVDDVVEALSSLTGGK